ncbi:MAG: GldG family protein [Treponema sp.]|nr:GldG family protein [Treponema sp.]
MTKKQTTLTMLMTLAAIALCLLVSRQFWFRADITAGRVNTISPVSRNLHTEIGDTVRITYFISDRLKAIHPMPGEIEDFLREYVGFQRGKVRLAVRDPVRENMAQEIQSLGIVPQQIQTVEEDQASVSTVFSGILIEYLDEVSVMPVVFATDTLEYELTSRIRALVRDAPRVLGVLLGGAETNPGLWEESYSLLNAELVRAGYRIRSLRPGEEIPETLTALLVLDGVESLDFGALLAVDRYILAGGRALFTAKAVGIDVQEGLQARLLQDGGLLAMLAAYGAAIRPEIAMDEAALTMQYQSWAANGGIQLRFFRNFQWIRVLPENGNPEHPVSARFGGLDMYWANPILLAPPEGVVAEPLFTTTEAAWTMREPFITSPEMEYMMLRDSEETSLGPRILGASLSGIFPPWFYTPPPGGGGELPPVEPAPARIIVIGESDFATSFITVTGAQHNFAFILQALDWLAHDDDIIGIRARTAGSGRLDRIADPDARAAAMAFARTLNIFVMPLLVIAAGIVISQRRRLKLRPQAALEDEHGV